MKVKDLIKELQKYPKDYKVWFSANDYDVEECSIDTFKGMLTINIDRKSMEFDLEGKPIEKKL